MSRWQRYWFADGGRHASAVVRVAIAVSVLLSLWRLWSLDPLVAPAALYRPVGVWMVMGRTVPPEALIALLWVLAWGGTICMLIGLGTRVATAVSFGASIALAAISFSGTATWSHQYNVVFIAQCAFLGARCGDVWSIDALIRKLRGKPSIKVPRGYQWSLRLVQLAVALMFAGAVFHKLLHGHGTLRWALSDNLRHHLLVRYDLAGLDRPWLVEWIIDDVWKYRGAALLNLVTQLAPLIAVIFVRRPWVRAIGGLAFVTETIALGLVISLWNLHWLPLVAVFIDWDALLGTATTPPPPADWKPPRGPRIFIIVFVVYEIITSFIPTLDQRLNTFPFSGFPMFATIRAEPPYGDHHDYVLPGDHIEPIGSTVHKFAQRWLDHSFRGLYNERDPERIKARLAQIVEQAPSRYPDATIKGVRAYVMLFVAPAYPARARFEPHPVAVTGELHPDGTFKTLLGSLDGAELTLRPRGIDTSTVELAYYADDRPERIPITGATRVGDVFTLPAPLPLRRIYVVATIAGTTWLVASQK